jgi:hypothetical protein
MVKAPATGEIEAGAGHGGCDEGHQDEESEECGGEDAFVVAYVEGDASVATLSSAGE